MDTVEALKAEVARCHERLEIDHAYTLGEDGKFVRFEVPMADRPQFPDAVTALNIEVRCLTEDRDELAVERDKLFAAARDLTMTGKVARGYVKVDAEKFAALAQLLVDLSDDEDDAEEDAA